MKSIEPDLGAFHRGGAHFINSGVGLGFSYSYLNHSRRTILSHSRSPTSMLRICGSLNRPRSLSARTLGTVAGLCTRKAPGLRNGSGMLISNREPRSVVVWGTTVMTTRSFTSQGPLKINAGRTFSTIPRSTSQTSPRFGTFLLFVEHLERDTSALLNVFVCQRFAVKLPDSRRRKLTDALPQLLPNRALIRDGQRSNLLEHRLGFRTHVLNDTRDVFKRQVPASSFRLHPVSHPRFSQ
jgi:hypothetical protein